MLEPGSRQWGEARKCLLVIQSVLQLLKHSRECLVRRECIDSKEGIDSSGIDGGADDVRDNHRPQHSSVTCKLLSVSTLHIILCAKSAEDYTETTMYQHFTCHLQYSSDSGRGYVSDATK